MSSDVLKAEVMRCARGQIWVAVIRPYSMSRELVPGDGGGDAIQEILGGPFEGAWLPSLRLIAYVREGSVGGPIEEPLVAVLDGVPLHGIAVITAPDELEDDGITETSGSLTDEQWTRLVRAHTRTREIGLLAAHEEVRS